MPGAILDTDNTGENKIQRNQTILTRKLLLNLGLRTLAHTHKNMCYRNLEEKRCYF